MALDGVFWQSEREKLLNTLGPLVRDAALHGAEWAHDDLVDSVGVGVDWALVNEAVRHWADRYSAQLVTGINNITQRVVQDAVTSWISSGEPLDVLKDSLTPMFGDTRAEMISVTEVTRAYAEGNRATWQESGVVDGMKFFTARDDIVCPICEPLDGEELDLNAVDGMPPIHVNCRCYVQPVINAGKAIAWRAKST